MGLLKDCEKFFGTNNLYEAFNVPRDASSDEIKKAYRRLSLLIHPDRVEESEKDLATKKFQVLGRIYVVLSDADKRSLYDETAVVDEEDGALGDREWTDYWRCLFPKITPEMMDEFLQKYRGSEEELSDLKAAYERFKGDLNLISETLIGYDVEDEERYRQMLFDLIAKKEVKAYPAFTKESARKRKARKARYEAEAKEVEEMRAACGMDGSTESLRQTIARKLEDREKAFDNMIAALEEKYGNKERKRKSKKMKT